MTLPRLAMLATAALLSGCVVGPRPATLSPELQKALDTPLYCSEASECKLVWERGIYYVANNSRWRVMAETSNLIETEYPDKGYYGLAYRITREPMGNGRYRISTQAWCGLKDWQCKPHADEGVARAKYYMMTGQSQDKAR
ncbi:hypothetical protein ACFZAI_23550 [Achromobacter sp. NPDC008082]|uniref:hypothetical protein n=1 Tax=Achromobacter sp. NPDC008082 TaxID=3363888 RepID=UPI0036E46CE5